MSATADIQAKYNSLVQRGLNLGNKVGIEEDAGFGGRLQKYQSGHIYWHHAIGTFEVHGGILTKYLSLNGPAFAPNIGKRLLGFPRTDETAVLRDGYFPISYFEWGAIYWINGGVAVSGEVYTKYSAMGAEKSALGYPVADNQFFPFGEVGYFEKGCIWKSSFSASPIVMNMQLPMMGNPLLVDIDNYAELTNRRLIQAELNEPERLYLEQNLPNIIAQIWNGKIGLQAVGQSSALPLQFSNVNFSESNSFPFPLPKKIKMSSHIVWQQETKLTNRTLYNLVFTMQGRNPVILSPHALYARQSWDNFGLIHATDIHVSRRLEGFRRKLYQAGHTEGVQEFNNWNDAFRDLIKYANKLHSLGALDGLILTGDLIDYIFENDDNREGGGNFAFFENIVLGKIPYPDKDIYPPNASKVQEELRVPIFTTLGNHDYRPNAYDLVASLDTGDFGDVDLWPGGYRVIENYSSFNLKLNEAKAVQGGSNVYYDMDKAASKVTVSVESIGYYLRQINNLTSFTVNMGINRLIMLNTEYDEGIVGASAGDAVKYILGFLSESEKNFLDGNPDSKGLDDYDINILKSVLSEAGTGAVIVGMHAPPINPKGNEFPHYFRETEHPTIDPHHVSGYILRQDPVNYNLRGGVSDHTKPHPDWIRTGSLNFKKQSPTNLLDFGASKGKQEDFLKLCEGKMGTRQVNLVLSGHGHKRTEYRLGWNDDENFLRVYMDFYTENPTNYYPSVYNEAYKNRLTGVNSYMLVVSKTKRVHLNIVAGSPINGAPARVTDHRPEGWNEFYYLNVPPYANPLNTHNNPAAWWQQHSPIVVETAGLGPMEVNNRTSTADEKRNFPGAYFQGFRFIQVANNVISKVRYVRLEELRKNNFKMPWEPPGRPRPDIDVVVIDGGIKTKQ